MAHEDRTNAIQFWGIAAAICAATAGLSYGACALVRGDNAWAFVGLGSAFGLLAIVSLGVATTAYLARGKWQPSPLTMPRAPRKQPPRSASGPAVQTMPDGRVVVGVTTDYLANLYKQNTASQGAKLAEVYLDKWIRISAKVFEVFPPKPDGGVTVVLRTSDSADFSVPRLHLYFPPEWTDRVSVLNKGDAVTALCRIGKVSAYELEFEDCELLDESR